MPRLATDSRRATVPSVSDDGEEVAAVRCEQLAGDALLTRDDWDGYRSCRVMYIEVAGNRVGVDVELDRTYRSGAHECGGKPSR